VLFFCRNYGPYCWATILVINKALVKAIWFKSHKSYYIERLRQRQTSQFERKNKQENGILTEYTIHWNETNLTWCMIAFHLHPKTPYPMIDTSFGKFKRKKDVCMERQGSSCGQAILPSPILRAETPTTALLCMLRNNNASTNIPSPCYLPKGHRLW